MLRLKQATARCVLVAISAIMGALPTHSFAQAKAEGFTYPVVLFSPYPDVSMAPVVKQALKPAVIQKLPPSHYQLIVLAEANTVSQGQGSARLCSVTVGISRKVKTEYHVPNVRFNAMGYSTNAAVDHDSEKWEKNCIESALGKALNDLSLSDLDYVKFMANR